MEASTKLRYRIKMMSDAQLEVALKELNEKMDDPSYRPTDKTTEIIVKYLNDEIDDRLTKSTQEWVKTADNGDLINFVEQVGVTGYKNAPTGAQAKYWVITEHWIETYPAFALIADKAMDEAVSSEYAEVVWDKTMIRLIKASM